MKIKLDQNRYLGLSKVYQRGVEPWLLIEISQSREKSSDPIQQTREKPSQTRHAKMYLKKDGRGPEIIRSDPR